MRAERPSQDARADPAGRACLLLRVVHGVTADPLATRYARLLTRQADRHIGAEEHGSRSAGSSAGQPAHAARREESDRVGQIHPREGDEPAGYRYQDLHMSAPKQG
jgi:hypothetical protein